MSSSIESDEIPTAQIDQLMNSMKINSETNKDYVTTAKKDSEREDDLENSHKEYSDDHDYHKDDYDKDSHSHHSYKDDDDDYDYKKSHSRDEENKDDYKRSYSHHSDDYKQKSKNSDEDYKKYSDDKDYKKYFDDRDYKKDNDYKDSVSNQIDDMINSNNYEYKKYKSNSHSHSRSNNDDDYYKKDNRDNQGMTTELNNIINKKKYSDSDSKDDYYDNRDKYKEDNYRSENVKIEEEKNNEDLDEYENLTTTQKKLARMDLLRKLAELKKKGYNISNEYSINSDYYTMKEEYIYQMSIKGKDSFVKNTFSYGLNFIKLIEFANKKYDPLGIDLDGWNMNVESSKEEIIDAISEIYEKYHKPGSGTMSPELRLLLILVSSAVSTVIANSGAKVLASMFKNSEVIKEKDKEEVLKNLSRNFSQEQNTLQIQQEKQSQTNQTTQQTLPVLNNGINFIPQQIPSFSTFRETQFTNLRDEKKQESINDINNVVSEIKTREYNIPPPRIPLTLRTTTQQNIPESANNIFDDMIKKQKLSKKQQI